MTNENAIEKVVPVTLADPVAAQRVDGRINEILDQEVKALEIRSKRGAELGRLLLQVQEEELYEPLGFKTFTQWLEAKKFGLGRPQLYGYKTSAEQLLPYLTDETFDAIGIEKLRELARMVKASGGIRPDAKLVELARKRETTVNDLRTAIAIRMNIPDNPSEKWFSFGFYLSEEERAEIEECFQLSLRLDPPIPQDWKASRQRKEWIMRMVQECKVEWMQKDPETIDVSAA
jgi:hypothetical protein